MDKMLFEYDSDHVKKVMSEIEDIIKKRVDNPKMISDSKNVKFLQALERETYNYFSFAKYSRNFIEKVVKAILENAYVDIEKSNISDKDIDTSAEHFVALILLMIDTALVETTLSEDIIIREVTKISFYI